MTERDIKRQTKRDIERNISTERHSDKETLSDTYAYWQREI